jgi:triacylglycerol lipase
VPIYFPVLPSVGLIEDRARALADYLGTLGAEQIDLIAHSMGGLDSRYLIHNLDPQQRVHSLTTIATPHRGSPLAQWTLEKGGSIYGLLRRISQPGVHDLTPQACARFNAEISDRPDVRYRSYAGMRPAAEMPLPFRPWTRAMQQSDGDNDSQVSLSSALWGEFQGTLRADHLELAGWSFAWPNKRTVRPFDHFGFYWHLVQELCSG